VASKVGKNLWQWALGDAFELPPHPNLPSMTQLEQRHGERERVNLTLC